MAQGETNPDATGDPAVKAREVLVDVYAYKEGDDVLFAQAWKLEGEQGRKNGHIKIKEGEGDVPIRFRLHDRTNLDLAFLPVGSSNQDSPFWCSAVDCPTEWGDGNGQIKSVENLPNDTLKVVDANSGDPCTLHYALRFTGKNVGSGPPYAFDPDIRNGGGGVGGGSG
jgi:hypothetical protein